MAAKFTGKNVLIVGDVMLDKYTFGEVERISPEAPVPIVNVQRESFVPGGAANTANNVASLLGNAILSGIVGNDAAQEILIHECQARKIDTSELIKVSYRPTVQKIRIIAQSQQLLRIDIDPHGFVDAKISEQLPLVFERQTSAHAVVISDYGKGVVTERLMQKAREFSQEKNIPLIVDPKPQNKAWYGGVYLITPNKKEAEGMVGRRLSNEEDILSAGQELVAELNTNVLITVGERGMYLFEKNAEPLHILAEAKEVYDVSGAGDTVVATLSLGLCSGMSLKDATILANHAAGIKVGKFGTAPVSFEEIRGYL